MAKQAQKKKKSLLRAADTSDYTGKFNKILLVARDSYGDVTIFDDNLDGIARRVSEDIADGTEFQVAVYRLERIETVKLETKFSIVK